MPSIQVVALFISAITSLIVVLTYIRSGKGEIKAETESLLKANMKLDQICSTTNETRADIKSINNQIKDLTEKSIKHGIEIDTIWKRIDEIRGVDYNSGINYKHKEEGE